MKRLYLGIAFALLAFSCGKNPDTELRRVQNENLPVWYADETMPVPIEFGLDAIVQTKADGTVDENVFYGAGFRYGIYAQAVVGSGSSVALEDHVEIGRGKAAKNGLSTSWEDGIDGIHKATFVTGTYYYPMLSDKNYTFYAYRTDNAKDGTNTDSGFELSAGNRVNNIDVGYCDILWAKAWATPFGRYEGFNARYVRALMDYVHYDHMYLTSTSAPRFNFKHLTSRFVFNVRATDVDAQANLKDLGVYVKRISISGVKTHANLQVAPSAVPASSTDSNNPELFGEYYYYNASKRYGKTGETYSQSFFKPLLSVPDGEVGGTLNVVRESADPFYPVQMGATFGEPLFVLPSDVDPANIDVTLVLNAPSNSNYPDDEVVLTTSLKKDGGSNFLSGMSYTFTITINSFEKISITTELTPWDSENGDEITVE